MKILIVDDERLLVEALVAIFKQNHIEVDVAFNGVDGLDMALSGVYDCLILDVMMPKLNGFEVVAKLRKQGNSTPTLMLSARSEVGDKIDGLNYGADDYLTKPFNTGELLARVKALTRRHSEYIGDYLTFNDISLNCDTHELYCQTNSIFLGSKEFQIMEVLIKNKDMITTKDYLIEKIWGIDTNSEYNATEVYTSFLRKKLNLLKSNTLIKSIRGTGYRLEAESD